MQAYNQLLNTYIYGDQSTSSEPIILLSVADPNGTTLNTNRIDYRPNEGFLSTDLLQDYRPDDYIAITKVSEMTGF